MSVGEALTGVAAMGPAIIVDGCLRSNGHDEDRVFSLESDGRAQSLGEGPAPHGIQGYHLIGNESDLKRHVDQKVEIIGLVQQPTTPAGSTGVRLDTKSVRATAEKCSE